jgi:hypothetical protein
MKCGRQLKGAEIKLSASTSNCEIMERELLLLTKFRLLVFFLSSRQTMKMSSAKPHWRKTLLKANYLRLHSICQHMFQNKLINQDRRTTFLMVGYLKFNNRHRLSKYLREDIMKSCIACRFISNLLQWHYVILQWLRTQNKTSLYHFTSTHIITVVTLATCLFIHNKKVKLSLCLTN